MKLSSSNGGPRCAREGRRVAATSVSASSRRSPQQRRQLLDRQRFTEFLAGKQTLGERAFVAVEAHDALLDRVLDHQTIHGDGSPLPHAVCAASCLILNRRV